MQSYISKISAEKGPDDLVSTSIMLTMMGEAQAIAVDIAPTDIQTMPTEQPLDWKIIPLGGRVGKGSSSSVHKHSGRNTVIKHMNFINKNLLSLSNCMDEKNQLRAWTQLRAPIPAYIGYFITGTHFYIEMEQCTKGNLYEYIKSHPLSLEQKYTIMKQMTDAVYFFHVRGYVHADIKSDNFLVSHDNSIKLCDLCFLRKEGEKNFGRGTLDFSAPEILRGGKNEISRKSDIYSLAICFLEVLQQDDAYSVHFKKHIKGAILSGQRPSIPLTNKKISNIIRWCWEEDRNARPTIYELQDEFQTDINTLSQALQKRNYPTF